MSLDTLRNLTAKQLNRAAKIKGRIEKLETQFTGLLGVPGSVTKGRMRSATAGQTVRRRRKMSAAAKAKIAAAQKKRWAKWRAGKA
jgi:hypothetical protein